MKTKSLLFVLFLFATAFSLSATVTTVYTSAALGTAVTGAADGDVIVIGQCDSILTQTALTVMKHITIEAANGLAAMPQLKIGFLLNDKSSLKLDGLEIFYDKPGSVTNTDSKYGIQMVSQIASIDSIKIINCVAMNFGRGLIRADNSTNIATIGSIVIDNSVISNVSSVSNSYPIINIKTAKVSNITITNTTFANGLSAVISSQDATTPVIFLMDKVTMYNCGKTSTKGIISFSSPAGSSFAVHNSIMYYPWNSALASDTLKTKAIDLSAAVTNGATASLNNSVICSNLFTNKILPLIGPSGSSWSTYNLLNVNMFQDLDFTAYTLNANPVLTGVGDPRWTWNFLAGTGITTSQTNTLSIRSVPGTILISQPADVEILNVTGKEVMSATQSTSVSTVSLPKGVYIVRAQASTTSVVQKVIVQ